MKIPEPDVNAKLDSIKNHQYHFIGQLWVQATSGIPGQWETWHCRTCNANFEVYRS